MRRTATIGTLGVIAALALALAASGSGEPAKGAEVIRATGEITSQEFVDSPPGGESAGDLLVFTEPLFRSGRRIGEITGSCTMITPPARFQCRAIAKLRRGSLVVAANVDEASEGRSTGAITGGTGRFRRARGTVTVEPIAEGRERITYRVFD